jgi:hypothetical protein
LRKVLIELSQGLRGPAPIEQHPTGEREREPAFARSRKLLLQPAENQNGIVQLVTRTQCRRLFEE